MSKPDLLLGMILGGFLLGSVQGRAEPTADGLYARFTTSLGEFWCRLEFEKTPRTVANFVGLAEGTRPWLDFLDPGIRQQPFYDGVTFHRVIKNFMNQSGSRNGQGTDGPGYAFKDEFHPQLRHDRAGILSMANSGTNSNGAQFFVTTVPTPWLDNKHSVFGEVVEGYAVVQQINTVPTSTGDKPVTPVILQSVRILRLGAAALAFDPAGVNPALPSVAGTTASLKLESGRLTLSYPLEPLRGYHVFFGPDLLTWHNESFDSGPLNASSLLGQPRFFFQVFTGGYEL
jgi:cyclophilin family peptidyl-prolyl cis-trans isomerase